MKILMTFFLVYTILTLFFEIMVLDYLNGNYYHLQSLKNYYHYLIDILSLDTQKYHAIRLKINKNFEYIKTSHISLVNDAWAQGYEIFIFNGTQEINIRDCTVKELRPVHNIQGLLQANKFKKSGVDF